MCGTLDNMELRQNHPLFCSTPARPPAAGPASTRSAANKNPPRTASARVLVTGPPLPDVLLALHVIAPVTQCAQPKAQPKTQPEAQHAVCVCPIAMHECEGPRGVAYVIAQLTPPVLQPSSYELMA